jgi:S1-C subfamily serine protease
MARCLDHENRRIATVGALFGVPRLDARRALEETFNNLRRELVRDIVTSQRRAPTAPSPVKSPEPDPIPERPSVTSGTAFFVGGEGQLLTNNHVVRECKTIFVTSNAGNSVAGTVYARDATNDLALVKTDLKQTRQAAWRQGARLGEAVAAFGYPFATVLASSGNFTVGHITALSGLGDDSRFIQISAPIQPGNSGGPLLDHSGNLVGVVTGKLDEVKFNFPQNVNFAINASVVSAFLSSNSINSADPISSGQVPTTELAAMAKALSAHVLCLR